MEIEHWTESRLVEEFEREGLGESLPLIRRWLDRGDGVAVYENQDLGHPGLGDRKYVSFGSPAAQLETVEPPEQLPDIGGNINWRFRLIATSNPNYQKDDDNG